MSKAEICVAELELENCKGDLGTLRADWQQALAVSATTLTESKGKTADAVSDCINVTKQVTSSFQTLLDNTYDFFTQMGVVFRESDEEAARNIDTITGN
ncbi:MAG: hypothetical protein LUH03_04470 [Oscillospiraceae bacterium]|nr:hypothetical protein [Oscillospiraceae bacterium]